MRVLVCGGRNYRDRTRVFAVLDEIAGISENQMLPEAGFVIIHGCAAGADSFADDWAVTNQVQIEEYPALWDDLTVPGAIVRYRRIENRKDFNVADYLQRFMPGIWEGRQEGDGECAIAFADKSGFFINAGTGFLV
jgi:hypothetical protein